MQLVATESVVGRRLDQAIATLHQDMSRRLARAALDFGVVFVNGVRVKRASRLVSLGERIELNLSAAFWTAQAGEARALAEPTVLSEDAHILVVDKPTGWITAPTPEGDRGTLLWHLSKQRTSRVWLVHRIDRETSGVLVFAKSSQANRVLGEMFVAHNLERRYWTMLVGQLPADSLDVRADVAGKSAHTGLTVVARHATHCQVHATLTTGRTHQIRLHAAGLGCPVAGDTQHGGETARNAAPKAPRLALHAQLLAFSHPITGENLRFESPLPDDLQQFAAGMSPLVSM